MYKRVLLKFSGEALKDEKALAVFNGDFMTEIAKMMKELHKRGVQMGVVIGGGNIWRGKLRDEIGVDRVPADFMGMLATVMNAIALSGSLKQQGVDSVVFSALPEISDVTVTYTPEAAIRAMEEGKVAFFAGGTGKPYFTTDTAATMRALETNCEAIFMGKHGVKGLYDKDPTKYKDAKFIPSITFREIIDKNLQIMDLTAVELIKDKDIEIRLFSMEEPENFIKVAMGEELGTVCKKGE